MAGAELDELIVPFEARLEAAVNSTKGCYVGQEIIARIAARGQVNNRMVGLRLGAAAPPPPTTPIIADGKAVGRTVTSVCSPALDETIAPRLRPPPVRRTRRHPHDPPRRRGAPGGRRRAAVLADWRTGRNQVREWAGC